MENIKLNAYALFVGEEFAATLFVPSEHDEWSIKITAALKSNPTIYLDEECDLPNTARYSIFVGDEYVDKLYQATEYEELAPVNAALQSNPRVVWINDDSEDVGPEITWRYENNKFIRNV